MRRVGRWARAKREKLAAFSYLLLFSLVYSCFLLFSSVCTMGNSPAYFNMSLRHGVVFSMAGGLCCVLSVARPIRLAAFRQVAAAARCGGDRPTLHDRREMWGSGKTATPLSRSGRIVPSHPPNAPTSRGSGKTGHGLSRAVP